MSRTYYTPRCRTPPIRASAPERTYATPHAATRVRDRSHAHSSHTRAGTDRAHRQLVTARRYTGLTVTFSRPAESRLDTHTASEVEHARSVLRSAVGRFSLDPAHHPRHTDAGASSAPSRPSRAASLAQRLRICDKCRRLVQAPHTRVRRRPLHLADVTRDCGIQQGLGADDDWSRISHLGSSGSAGNGRAAAVQLSRQTPPRALQIQVRMRVLGEQVCTECRS